jgi:membrane protease YdiL (CAAX protease family)
MELIQLSWVDHITAIVFAVVLPLFAIFKSQPKIKKIRFTTPIKISVYLSNSISLWIGAILILLIWYFHGRSAAQIGLPLHYSPISSIGLGLIALFIVLYFSDMGFKLFSLKAKEKLTEKWQKELPFLPATKRELYFFFLLSLSAGVCEEVIFRGYMINYFLGLFGGNQVALIMAVVLPGLIFAVSHIYQGWAAVFKIVLMSIIFGAFFVIEGSIWPLIILHTLVDIFSGMVAYSLLSKIKPVAYLGEEEE